MKRMTNRTVHALNQPLAKMYNNPVVANRPPGDYDFYDIGQIWIDKRPGYNQVWILTGFNDGVHAGIAIWTRVDSDDDALLTWIRTADNNINTAANSGYILHTAAQKTLTLPNDIAIGSTIGIVKDNIPGHGIRIALRNGQTITYGVTVATAPANNGVVQRANQTSYQYMEIVCIQTNVKFIVSRVTPVFAFDVY